MLIFFLQNLNNCRHLVSYLNRFFVANQRRMQPNDGRVGRRKDLMDAIITFLEPPRAQEMMEGRKLPERERDVYTSKEKEGKSDQTGSTHEG